MNIFPNNYTVVSLNHTLRSHIYADLILCYFSLKDNFNNSFLNSKVNAPLWSWHEVNYDKNSLQIFLYLFLTLIWLIVNELLHRRNSQKMNIWEKILSGHIYLGLHIEAVGRSLPLYSEVFSFRWSWDKSIHKFISQSCITLEHCRVLDANLEICLNIHN